MEATEFIWLNGEFIKWEDAKVHFLTHSLHYGSGAFEGIRVYKTQEGSAVFRLGDHLDRLFYSISFFKMKLRFTKEDLLRASLELLRRNKKEQCYLRPLAFFGYGVMGVDPGELPGEVALACWPWGMYLPHAMVDIKISDYIRIHPKSLPADAKICGNYVNGTLAGRAAKAQGYDEALFLDYRGFVAEGPGENIFFVKDGILKTPKLGSILRGITRDTVMVIARQEGISIEECDITPEEALAADEAFFTGTAAEVAPIRSIDDHVFGDGSIGPITAKLKSMFSDTIYGRRASLKHYLTYVDAPHNQSLRAPNAPRARRT